MSRLINAFSRFKDRVLNLIQLSTFTDFRKWRESSFALPAPIEIKLSTLIRYGGACRYWIESGTYLGDTTRELSSIAEEVHTIEPSKDLFRRGKARLSSLSNVFCYNGLSENIIGNIIDNIVEKTINTTLAFFLDGHFSHNDTHKGPVDTPILHELSEISKRLPLLENVVVMVDDVRLFTGLLVPYEEYPKLITLVSWAEENGLFWTIENDIFVAIKLLSSPV